jgi:hypothetical protein
MEQENIGARVDKSDKSSIFFNAKLVFAVIISILYIALDFISGFSVGSIFSILVAITFFAYYKYFSKDRIKTGRSIAFLMNFPLFLILIEALCFFYFSLTIRDIGWYIYLFIGIFSILSFFVLSLFLAMIIMKIVNKSK